jgi:hypothetical protein
VKFRFHFRSPFLLPIDIFLVLPVEGFKAWYMSDTEFQQHATVKTSVLVPIIIWQRGSQVKRQSLLNKHVYAHTYSTNIVRDLQRTHRN